MTMDDVKFTIGFRELFVFAPTSTTLSVSAKSFTAVAETLSRSKTPDIGFRKSSAAGWSLADGRIRQLAKIRIVLLLFDLIASFLFIF
jgi:hypothetical protein